LTKPANKGDKEKKQEDPHCGKRLHVSHKHKIAVVIFKQYYFQLYDFEI